MYDAIELKLKDAYTKATEEIKDLSQKKLKRKQCRWITPNTLRLTEEKNKLWNKIRRKTNVDDETLNKYRSLKNKVNNQITKDKQQYYTNMFEKDKDKKIMWRQVNTLTGKQNCSIDDHVYKHFKTDEITELTNKFNSNFVGQAKKLKQKYNRIPTPPKKTEQTIQKTMFVNEAQKDDIRRILKDIKPTKAVGNDGFLLEHFKNTAENSINFLTRLINCIIETEVWPEKLKTQVLRPVFKKGSKTNLDNYRPIAIQPAVNKIVEKYFAKSIQNFMIKYKIITDYQFGFQKQKGTTEALKLLNDKISAALNEGCYVGAILIDLQKAFDTLDRDILIKKLEKVGMRGKILQILKSYLNDRISFVKLGNTLSDELSCKDGVPQGSVLGPLLFLIYVNDLNDELNNENVILFADDIFLLSVHKNYDEMSQNLQLQLDKISLWCSVNEVFISEEKTVYMEIKTPHMKIKKRKDIILHDSECLKTSLCNLKCSSLRLVENAKYLGMHIDNSWKFTAHIDNLVKKLRTIMPKLYQIRNILNIKNKKVIYNAWIDSHLRYGLEIYGHASISRLQKIQNKIVKILFKNNGTKSTSDIYKDLGILTLDRLRNYLVITKNYFDIVKRSKDPRTSLNLKLPRWRNFYGKRHTNYYIPSLFNKLPKTLINLKQYSEIKQKIKNWLMSY
jgi:hypothetical protein